LPDQLHHVETLGFNENFIRAVSLHEKNEFDPAVSKDGLVVNLANMLTRKMGFSFLEWEQQDPAALPSAMLLGVTAEVIAKVEAKVKEIIKDVAHLF
jgi:hypothetical protein